MFHFLQICYSVSFPCKIILCRYCEKIPCPCISIVWISKWNNGGVVVPSNGDLNTHLGLESRHLCLLNLSPCNVFLTEENNEMPVSLLNVQLPRCRKNDVSLPLRSGLFFFYYLFLTCLSFFNLERKVLKTTLSKIWRPAKGTNADVGNPCSFDRQLVLLEYVGDGDEQPTNIRISNCLWVDPDRKVTQNLIN